MKNSKIQTDNEMWTVSKVSVYIIKFGPGFYPTKTNFWRCGLCEIERITCKVGSQILITIIGLL